MNTSLEMSALRKLFNDVDPMGIFFGENADEYDPEIKQLISLSLDYEGVSMEDLTEELKKIFEAYFSGLTLNSDLLGKLSVKIKEELGGGAK